MIKFFAILNFLITIFAPQIFYKTSYTNIFNVVANYLKNSTPTALETIIFQNYITILLTCSVFLSLTVIFIVIDIIENHKKINPLLKNNNLQWKEKYTSNEFNEKIIDELENAYIAIQELKQEIKEIKGKK